MKRTLTMALVGCGAIAGIHVPAIREGAPEIAITAAIDTDHSSAEAMALRKRFDFYFARFPVRAEDD